MLPRQATLYRKAGDTVATIYKRRDLRPIPEGAEIVTYRGKRYAKWTNAKTDTVQRAPLSPSGDKIVCESPYYTVQYFDHDGRRQKVATRCADRDAAQQLANELESKAMLRREGLIDPTQERVAAEGRRSLQEHLADFRAGELRSLTPASFDLDADLPTVTVDAGHSKRRRRDVQPFRSDLAELLRDWLEGRPADERLFSHVPHNTARMLRADLRAARAAWIAQATTDAERRQREDSDFPRDKNAAGEVFDFHATRHTYISAIVAGKPSVKTAQELARHSSPVLTIGRYSHARLHDLTAALDALPSLQPSGPDLQARRATGTDSCLPANRQQYADEKTTVLAIRGESGPSRNDAADCPKVLMVNTLGDNRRDVALRHPLGESNPCCRTENPES